jgi:APA family basic amino acid/polyamine antiporter
MSGAPERAGDGLRRGLNLWDTTLLIGGLVVGGSIFLTPGAIARALPSGRAMLAVWIAGGLLTVAGGMVYAEIGAMMPEAGGMYVFFREAYGRMPAFLFGWMSCFVIASGTVSAVAVGFAEYLSVFFPALAISHVVATVAGVRISAGQLTAVAAILLLTATHYVGIRQGARIQAIFTTLVVATMLWLAGGALLAGSSEPPPGPSFAVAPRLTAAGAATAMIAVLWAYLGWSDVVAAAGEVENPGRNLPLALIAGTAVVTLLYVGVVGAYLKVIPVAELATADRPAQLAAVRLFGPKTSAVIAASIVAAALGCVSASLVAGPRIAFAMARDGLFPRGFGAVHPRFGTPAFALLVQAAWASLLCLSGRYDQLYTYVMFAVVLAYSATGFCLFVFRRRRPDALRPYLCGGYPLVPAIFLASSLFFAASTIVQKPRETLAGLAILAAGVPVYFLLHRRSGGSE